MHSLLCTDWFLVTLNLKLSFREYRAKSEEIKEIGLHSKLIIIMTAPKVPGTVPVSWLKETPSRMISASPETVSTNMNAAIDSQRFLSRAAHTVTSSNATCEYTTDPADTVNVVSANVASMKCARAGMSTGISGRESVESA